MAEVRPRPEDDNDDDTFVEPPTKRIKLNPSNPPPAPTTQNTSPPVSPNSNQPLPSSDSSTKPEEESTAPRPPTTSSPKEESKKAEPTPKGQPRRWYYKDLFGKSQGPFTSRQMEQWWQSGFFKQDLELKLEHQENFKPLPQWDPYPHWTGWPQREEIQNIAFQQQFHSTAWQAQHNPGMDLALADQRQQQQQQSYHEEMYTQSGILNSVHGELRIGGKTHWDAQGQAPDAEGRHLGRFGKLDSIQEQLRRSAKVKEAKRGMKLGKKQIQKFQAQKRERQKRHLRRLYGDLDDETDL